MSTAWVEMVLEFWFHELKPDQWFAKSDASDAQIRTRFAGLYEQVANLDLDAWSSAREHLAAVIVLDQFPRNMFRGAARAFATDAKALAISRQAIERQLDRELNPQQRQFLYMPWQHSESADDQARSVALFEQLGLEDALDYARRHKEVIDRFGRFPHRNAALQRASTDEERAFVVSTPGF